MSNYGVQTYNPEEEKRQWKEHVYKEIKQSKKYKTNANVDKKINYYNSEKQYDVSLSYDRLFHVVEGYNPSHKRDDRTYNTKVEEEDVGKPVPTRFVVDPKQSTK